MYSRHCIYPDSARAPLLVGTSGYAYSEWVEAGFYPPGTRSRKMLPVYARCFPITELNYTWYQMPKASAVERMQQLAPPEFRFTAKLTRSMTHEVNPAKWQMEADRYREGIAPLLQSDQLMAILVQLPPGFKRTPDRRRYLARLLDALSDLPLAVEFRHSSWAEKSVFSELKRRCVTLVAVDTPALPELFPQLDVVTNPDLFYVRFHGRNSRGWRSGNMQQQFDYNYGETELRQWSNDIIPRMAAAARKGVIFFNNHVGAQAPGNAATLMHLLEESCGASRHPSEHC